jgi:hypothetical protein
MLRLIQPFFTRWSYFTKTATAILSRWDDQDVFLDKIYKAMKTKEEDMARKVLGVIKDPKLKCELEFIVTLGRLFFNKHFQMLQCIDEHTKESRFQAHEMLAQVCIMVKELMFLKVNWKTMDDFAPCVHILDNLPPGETSEVGGVKWAGKSLGCLPFLLFFLWAQCSVGQCFPFLFLFLLFRLFWLDSLGVSLLWSSYHQLQVQGVGRRRQPRSYRSF